MDLKKPLDDILNAQDLNLQWDLLDQHLRAYATAMGKKDLDAQLRKNPLLLDKAISYKTQVANARTALQKAISLSRIKSEHATEPFREKFEEFKEELALAKSTVTETITTEEKDGKTIKTTLEIIFQ